MRLRAHTEIVRDPDTNYPYRVTLTQRRLLISRIQVLEKRFENTIDAGNFIRGVKATAEIAGISLVCS